MKPIHDRTEISTYHALVAEITDQVYQLRVEWARAHGWKIVPAEDAAHFSPQEVNGLVAALNDAGFRECIAVATEPIDKLPSCYRVAVSVPDLREFNRECGVFRYLLTTQNRDWAISCNEWFNLFAGPPRLVEKMLGKPIDQAHKDFLAFARDLTNNPDEPLMKAAIRYAAI